MGVYLDYQATSPMPESVLEVYVSALAGVGNPSSIHQAGQRQRALVEEARERIARVVGCEPIEIVFTSGGTEAINTALKGAVWAAQRLRGRDTPTTLVSTRAEHHATLDALEWLGEHEGTEIAWVPVDSEGVMDLDSLEVIVHDHPATLVTTLLANNEVGSLQPVAEIARISAEAGVPVHVDAVAALGYVPVSFSDLQVAAMSISAHKVGGPVGVGALVLSRHAPEFTALVHGGDQQRVRAGTLDAPGALAFAEALELRERLRLDSVSVLQQRRDDLLGHLTSAVPDIAVRGSLDARLPGNLHITVPGCEGDVLLYLLDQEGIQVSTGSACQAGIPEPSHVVLAMGLDEATARGALRFSVGYHTSEDDIATVASIFPQVVERARGAGMAAGH
ncbi:cysteine desulfurase [Pontimonas sp.]|nr:cysteine desulfurase [Pontimonas sp.]